MKGVRFLLLFAFLCGSSVMAQKLTVSGTVCDSHKQPLSGVAVSSHSAVKGAVTDTKGRYSIAAARDSVLEFSIADFETARIKITGRRLNVTMTPDTAKPAIRVIPFSQQTPPSVIGPGNPNITVKNDDTPSKAAVIIISGTVYDHEMNPYPGVSVIVKNHNRGCLTDVNGKYTLSVNKGDTVMYSFIGFKTKEVKADRERIDVILQPQLIVPQPQVVAFDIQKRENIIGSVSAVGDQLRIPRAGYQIPTLYPVPEEEYQKHRENRFVAVIDEPLSTFSIDVDAASYGNMRRFLNQGQLPPSEAVRTEELINYFTYSYTQPDGKAPVNITAETGACPWNERHRLVKVGLKAKEIDSKLLPASNLVFLIDVSGSMFGPGRLDLVKSSLKLLVNNLREKDRIAIVVYAGQAGEVMPSTSGANREQIRGALDRLAAGGSTAGGAGIQLAYKIARKNFIKNGNNRIILCTDGDFNVGITSPRDLETLIENERQSGVFLTVLGYGMGNYKDNRMQTLAEKGNGNHAYIDNLQEANKVLVQEFGGTIFAVAKDVKLQLEFNPEHAQAYRLIGYESRLLNSEDFNDDTKDAGEMGVGHCVTAFYEVVPTGIPFADRSIDPLKYQKPTAKEKPKTTGSRELLTIKMRYKEPDSNTSKKIELPVIDTGGDKVTPDFRFAAAVAMFGQLLTNSSFKGNATYDAVISLAKKGLDNDEAGYRREFIRIAETAKNLSGQDSAD